nr:hypothetical protein Iba_chr03bCG15270 [Ipomoea batatas]
MVAVAVPVSPPDQHSPRLGHLASSQTVWSFNSLNFFLICVYFSPPGIASFIHFGFGSGFFFVPTSTEYSLSDWSRMKLPSVGDSAASLLRNPSKAGQKVRRRRAVDRESGDEGAIERWDCRSGGWISVIGKRGMRSVVVGSAVGESRVTRANMLFLLEWAFPE